MMKMNSSKNSSSVPQSSANRPATTSSTTGYRAFQWISYSNSSKSLVSNDITNVFKAVDNHPCNLISIFGRARQGKSFLMNCLAGETEIFRISNEKDSCTQGIDISNKWLSLSEFSAINNSKPRSIAQPVLTGGRSGGAAGGGGADQMKIGFVDAEGQGDKDVTYDANLICPILLMSKCVIFNWKGDLQKDHLLSTLGIMTRAAKNITNDKRSSGSGGGSGTSSNESKFGHLHIIFRDWQAVETDANEVYNAIMKTEGTSDASIRDLIRKDLLVVFDSIKVWLFDPPSESTKDLKQKLSFDRTSSTFKAQVQQLRATLSQQLAEPTLVAGNMLRGRSYGPLTSQIAASLNSGQVVLPSSAYLNMMRHEMHEVEKQYEREMRESIEQWLVELETHVRTMVGGSHAQSSPPPPSNATAAVAINQLYTKRSIAIDTVERIVHEIDSKYAAIVAESVGDSCSNDVTITIMSEYNHSTSQIKANVMKHFVASYDQQFGRWLLGARQAAERLLEAEMNRLADRLPMATDDDQGGGGGGGGLVTQPSLLQQLLNDIYSKMMSMIGGVSIYGADCYEVADAESILTTRFEALSEDIMRKNAARLEIARDEMNALLLEATEMMERVVQDTVMERSSACSSGYKLSDIETALNRQYRSIHSMLEGKLQSSPFRTQALQLFLDNCTNLSHAMTQQYHQTRQHAVSTAVGDARNHLTMLLNSFDTAKIWTDDVPFEMRRHALHSCLMKMTCHLKTTIIALVQGWFDSMTTDEQRSFTSRIDEQFEAPVVAFEDSAMVMEAERYAQSVINEEEQAKKRAHDEMQEEDDDEEEDVIEEDDDDDDDEEEEDGDEDDERDGSTVRLEGSSPKKQQQQQQKQQASKQQLSVEDQRKKAMDWATNQLGLSHTKSKRTSKAKTTAMMKKPTKSIEQQRQDALKYAEKLWGPDIGKLSPPPSSPTKLLSPSPPPPSHHSSNSSSSVRETGPIRSSNITPPLPPAAATRVVRKREASPPPTLTSPEARTTGVPLQESKKPRYGSSSLSSRSSSSSSSSSSHHRAEESSGSQKVHNTPHSTTPTLVESSSNENNNSSSRSTTATAAAAVVIDPLVAAREQMKKLNEERARAAGVAAAARLDKRGTSSRK